MDGELRSLRGRGNGRGGRAGGQPWLGPVHLSELRGQRSKRDARPAADAVTARVWYCRNRRCRKVIRTDPAGAIARGCQCRVPKIGQPTIVTWNP